jgi:diaminopimelate epimerase
MRSPNHTTASVRLTVRFTTRMPRVRFEKWQALGNDYLIVEQAELAFELTPARTRKLCAGHFGVFADGVLLLAPSEDPRFVAKLRIYNPDGSEAELSGNGAREAILYLRRRGWTDLDVFSIQTAAGEIRPTITGDDTCRVDMGHARLASRDFPDGPGDGADELVADGRAWSFQHVSIGNPQCAIHVKDIATLNALDLPSIGPAIEAHELFPNRTNVSWYTEVDPVADGQDATPGVAGGEPALRDGAKSGVAGEPAAAEGAKSGGTGGEPATEESATPPAYSAIRARIFERGVGETLSSGTGATGAAIAYRLSGGPAQVAVVLDGGELGVEIGEDLQVNLTGWARPVFEGRLSDDFVKELHETE